MTPTLSVDAAHDSTAVEPLTVPVRAVGADGAVVSGVVVKVSESAGRFAVVVAVRELRMRVSAAELVMATESTWPDRVDSGVVDSGTA